MATRKVRARADEAPPVGAALGRIALGNIPGLQNIDLAVNVSFENARDYLLPLRIETGRNPENGNERIYDYAEVTACIDRLVSGALAREDLPTYSAERRLAIQRSL